ncbi:MAG: YigZ family protein [Peptococcaceae bacterium]|nr:YigZ family protein [Peptococcaceae bacterium]
MLKEYNTILEDGRDEFSVSRSRFIGWSRPAKTEEEALAFIEEIKKKHWDATHNVWAYVLGEGGNIQRFSDDGEPSSSAGIPALEVIRKKGLQDVAVVVTRYFGGVKLGMGGLVRAYTQGAAIALAAGKIITRKPYLTRFVETEYSSVGKLQREFQQRDFPLAETEYGQKVIFRVLVSPQRLAELENFVLESTAGQALFREGPEVYVSIPRDPAS